MPFDEALNPYVERVRAHPLISNAFTGVIEHFQGKRTIVDLGCGNGHFLQEYLLKNPETVGLGIERRFKRSFKTAEKLQNLRARVVQMDVREFLESSPDHFWDEIWMQFPDPWPKSRHEKNRMITSSFVARLKQLLKPGGRFCFRSDCRTYWEFLQLENIRHSHFAVERSMKGNLFASDPSTLYQRKFETRGIEIYSLEWRCLK